MSKLEVVAAVVGAIGLWITLYEWLGAVGTAICLVVGVFVLCAIWNALCESNKWRPPEP